MSAKCEPAIDDSWWSHVSPWDGDGIYGDCRLMLRRATCDDDTGANATRVGFVRIDGELDAHTVSLIRDACLGLLNNCDEAWIDLGGVGFIDGAGARLLEQCCDSFDQRAGRCELGNASAVVRRLFTIVGLGGLIAAPDEPSGSCRSTMAGGS